MKRRMILFFVLMMTLYICILTVQAEETSGQTDISTCTVTLSSTSYTYSGSAKKPTVTVKNDTTTLSSGTDYTVSYSNNTNAGTATVTITGKGNYTGTVSKNFTINKDENTIKVKTYYSLKYSSKKRKIALGALAKENAKLTYDLDFGNANVNSKGIVTIKKKFTGWIHIEIISSETANYKKTTEEVAIWVTPTKTKITSVKSEKKNKVTISWKKNPSVTAYYIYISTKKDFSKNTKKVKATVVKNKDYVLIQGKKYNYSFTFKGLKQLTSGKTYYVQIRAYNDTDSKVWSYSKIKTVTVK